MGSSYSVELKSEAGVEGGKGRLSVFSSDSQSFLSFQLGSDALREHEEDSFDLNAPGNMPVR